MLVMITWGMLVVAYEIGAPISPLEGIFILMVTLVSYFYQRKVTNEELENQSRII